MNLKKKPADDLIDSLQDCSLVSTPIINFGRQINYQTYASS